jgi:hypothetical protein
VRTNDALLARGIAVPQRRFAGLNLPGFGGKKRAPGGAALDRGGGAWRLVVVLLVAGAAGYGSWISGEEGLYGQTKRARGAYDRRGLWREVSPSKASSTPPTPS